MKLRSLAVIAASIVGGVCVCTPALAGPGIGAVRVASGLSEPLYVTNTGIPGDDRVFIVEQRGGIKALYPNGTIVVYADLSAFVSQTGSERGLLGLAFHPDFANNGLLYVDYTASVGAATTIAELRVTGDPATETSIDPFYHRVLMTIAQPFSNHNGGWIAFGPDGYLYIGMGDGGSSGDPGNRAQTITNQLLGKMLRIDVDGNNSSNGQYGIPADNPFVGITGDDEIWDYGLRNPWRNCFDAATGDLFIADVGQNVIEEINFEPAGSGGGINYGWRCYEGNNTFNTTGCAPAATMEFPFQTYTHGGAPFRCSITGGYIYRGCAIPSLDGTYFYADYCSNQIWSLEYDGSTVSNFMDRTAELAPGGGLSIGAITSFGVDIFGEIYIVDQGGEVFKIVPDSLTDVNNDGIHDDCQCFADLDGDGDADGIDIGLFLQAYGTGGAAADIDGDGDRDGIDIGLFLQEYGSGC